MSSRTSAIVLASLVLLSAFVGVAAGSTAAGTAAFTDEGATSGGAEQLTVAVDQRAAKATSTDGDLRSGGSFWQGERLHLDASVVVGASAGDRTFEVWRVADDGRLNQRVRTFTVDESGTYVLDTEDLSGRFVIRHGGRPVYIEAGTAYLDSPPDGSRVTVESSAFRVERQTLSFTWSDPTVYPGQVTYLTVESNRASSVVAVSGDGLSFANLTTLFPASVYASDYDARSGENLLLLELGGTTSFHLDTTVLAPGDQPLDFDVVDAATVETASLAVQKPAADGRFRSIERHEHVGDVIEAELVCTHCFVVLGGPDRGFLDVVEIRDVNGDGNVSLRINTRYAGMAVGPSGYPSTVSAYTSPADSVERYEPGADLEELQESLNYNVVTLNDLRVQQGLASDGRYRPIDPGPIRLTVSSTDFVIDRSAYGTRPPLGAELVIRDETDVETVTLSPRSLDGVQPLAVPGGGFEVTAESLRDVAAPRSQVALGDRLVFRFDVSGVFGYLDARGVSVEVLRDNREEGIDLTLERLQGGNAGGAETIRLDQVEARIVTDPASDSIYLVLRTGGTSPSRLPAGEYRATLSLAGVAGTFERYSTQGGHHGYPYLAPGDSERVSGTVTVVEPDVTITDPAAGSSPYLTAGGDLVVTGTTTVAPGSTLVVVATATDYAWETRTTVTVTADGTWSGDLALGEAPGDEFDVAVYRGERALASGTFTVRPAPPDSGAGDGSSAGGSGADGSSAESGSGALGGGDGGLLPIPDLGGLTGLAVPVGGGIGVLVVVWGAWRFVIRRLLLS